MTTVIVTYAAPDGDSEIVRTRGVKFISGQPQELDVEEYAELIAKAEANPLFEVIRDGVEVRRKPGRPRKDS